MYIVLFLLFAAFVFVAFYDALIERNYTVYSTKIKKDLKITMISDLHSTYHGKEQKDLITRIVDAKPDIIALVGDIFDEFKEDDGAICFLKNLPKDVLCCYVSGNHEHKTGKWRYYCDVLSSYGIVILEESTLCIEEFNLAISGVSDPRKSGGDDPDYNLSDVIENKLLVNDDKYNFLLAHSPFYIDTYKKNDFDLILSGHTHGGQVRIPFILNGLFNRGYKKRLGFFPPYCGGIYRHGKMTQIVGRGVSNNPAWAPRIFNRREIVNVIIKNNLVQ